MTDEYLTQDLLTLHQATQDDLIEIKELFAGTVTTICTNDYDADQIAMWASTAQNTHRWLDAVNSQLFLLAKLEDTIVGFCSLEKGNYIDFMYVHKDYQRQGIAETLLNTIENEARHQGSKALTSDSSKTARPFFEKKGYIVIAEQVNIRQGLEIVNYKMKKVL